MIHGSPGGALVVLSALCGALAASAWGEDPPAPAAQAEAFRLVPGVLVDPARTTLYASDPAGNVRALAPSTGALRWEEPALGVPLTLSADRLLVQRPGNRQGALKLALLELGEKRKVVAEIAAPVPDWVETGTLPMPRGGFTVQGYARGDVAYVLWEFTARPVGAPRGAPLRRADGTLRVDLRTGSFEALARDQAPGPEPEPPAEIARWLTERQVVNPAWRSATCWAAIRIEVLGGVRRPLLERWRLEDGARLEPVVLAADGFGLPVVSADRRHLLAGRPGIATPTGWAAHEWRVTAVDTGAVMATWAGPHGVVPFFVAGSTLVLRSLGRAGAAEPDALRGLDLATGRPIWSVSLGQPEPVDVPGSAGAPR